MIDMTNDRANIAFIGETPWHGLGQQLTPGADLATWTKEAGLNWTAMESPVMYQNGEVHTWSDRKVIFRSDTGGPLAVVSNGYNVVQPSEIMGFFEQLVELGGFKLEVAGALSGGKRVWALAKVGEGAPIVDGDIVRPYLLLGTSFDGSMATVAKFTAIRVVCNNTITASVGEAETDKGYVKSAVRVLHREKFDADEVRRQLGVVTSEFERFMVTSRQLAHTPMSKEQADAFVAELLEPYRSSESDVRESKGYKRIVELFSGKADRLRDPGHRRDPLADAERRYPDRRPRARPQRQYAPRVGLVRYRQRDEVAGAGPVGSVNAKMASPPLKGAVRFFTTRRGHPMPGHKNRSKSRRSSTTPSPAEVRAAREAAKLTQTEAAERIHGTLRAWQDYEGGQRRMHPGLFELFLIKTGQPTGR